MNVHVPVYALQQTIIIRCWKKEKLSLAAALHTNCHFPQTCKAQKKKEKKNTTEGFIRVKLNLDCSSQLKVAYM